MAKIHFGTKLLSTVLATFALASCQSESTLLEPATDNLRDVEFTVIASKGEELTRTDLNLSEDQKKLLLTWNVGDLIHVSESDGRYTGSLEVTELLDNGKKAKFKGTIRTILTNGKRTFKFSYLGLGDSYIGSRNNMAEPKVYDFTNQVNAGVNALAKNDLLVTDGEVDLKDGEATFENLFMRRQFAFGRFTLLYNGEPLEFSDNTVVTINTSTNDIKTGATFDFKSDDVTPAGNSSISLTTSENDFYVTFVPGSQKSAFKFNVDINGEEYEGFSSEYLIEKNDFYRRGSDVEIGEAMPINVTHVDGRDNLSYKLTYYANINGSTESYPETKAYKAATEYFDVKDYMLSPVYGYEFTGWNTLADGNGQAVAVGATVEMSYPDNMEKALYAQWEQTVFDYTLVFEDGNGTTLASKEIKGGKEEKVTVDDYDDEAVAKLPADKKFSGWALNDDATRVVEIVEFDEIHATKTVVPVYDKYDWVVKFVDEADTNTVYGTGRVSSEEPTLVYIKQFPTTPTKEGYTFAGWKYNGKEVADYPATKRPVLTKDNLEPVIYATWTKNKVNYQLIYHQNYNGSNLTAISYSGETTKDSYIFDVEEYATLPSFGKTTKDGYEFTGWNTKADGSGTAYKVGDKLPVTAPDTEAHLYAQWKKQTTVTTPGYGHGEFN